MKIAIIGSGISGLGAAFLGQENGHEIHLFEKANYFGGHSNTIEISDGNNAFWADTGFLVHNPKTYPNLLELLKILSVKTIDSQMTLSVQLLNEKIEWGGTSIGTLFAQKANLIRPGFYRMVVDILRFNRIAPIMLERLKGNAQKTLHDLILEYRFSKELQDWYLIPMAAAIWSTPASKILEFPALSFLQFCLNHNLLQVEGRPIWRTIEGGSRQYVKKIVDKISNKYLNCDLQAVYRSNGEVLLKCSDGLFQFDKVIFATHADQTRKLLTDINTQESEILSAFPFQNNRAVVHSDPTFLPKRKKLWSAWNYASSNNTNQVSVSYLLNKLQQLPTQMPVIVTLNPHKEVDPKKVHRVINYEHPIFDNATNSAQSRMKEIQGLGGIYHTGAWQGYGFHEDGLKSALRVARQFNWKIPWCPVYE